MFAIKKIVLATIAIIILFTGCGGSSSDDGNQTKTYERDYYEKIDYSDIDKVSEMLLEKDPRFKDLNTPIPIERLTVRTTEKNIIFDFAEQGMTDDGKAFIYAIKDSYSYQQIDEGNKTVIVLIDNNNTEEQEDDKVIIAVRFGKENIITRNIKGMTITEFISNELNVTFPESVMVNGSVTIEYDDKKDYAVIRDGDLGTIAFNKMIDITKNYPNINTIMLKNVDGSIHDAINMQTGFLLRESGLNTYVIDTAGDGPDIASGGVDLFCAGFKRGIDDPKKIKLGIHSWSDGDIEGRDFLKNSYRHHDQLLYFSTMLGVQDGYEFYFHTLEASEAHGIHLMSDEEIRQYGILTK